jgi:eukaryotic-like serine/threonine-protein kinase
MHQDILYAVFAVRNGYITSQDFTNIFYSWVVDPSRDIVTRLKQKIGNKKFDALKVLVSSSIDKMERNVIASTDKSSTTEKELPPPPGYDSAQTLSQNTHARPTIQIGMESTLQGEFQPGGDPLHNLNVTIEQEGRYTIHQEFARGGIGRILIASDNHIGREIAIKELLPTDFSPMGLEISDKEVSLISKQMELLNTRFLREARVTGQLEHPSIVPVYEIGRRNDGTLYYSMRFVKGKTMADVIYGATNITERLTLLPHFRDLCHAISYAHSKNVIHRDIKPENVMIGEFGETAVLDWGLAKVKGEADEVIFRPVDGSGGGGGKTIDGRAMGTPSYMPPEQARGTISEVDNVSDIYSVGAVLYEMLTGVPPFEGETAYDTLNMVLGYNIIPVKEKVPSAPRELAAIAEKALSKDKSLRYQNASELISEIESYMSGERISAYEYSKWDLLKRFVAANKFSIVSLGVFLIALIVSLIFISFSYTKEVNARQDMQEAVKKEVIERNKANYHIAQTLNEKSYRLTMDSKFVESKIFALLSLKINPANEKSTYYDPLFIKKFPQAEQLILEAESKIYRGSVNYSINLDKIIDLKTEGISIKISEEGSIGAVGCEDNSIKLFSPITGKIAGSLIGHKGIVTGVDITSNGNYIVSSSKDSTIKIWDTSRGRVILSLPEHLSPVFDVCLSRDNRNILSGSFDKTARVWDFQTGIHKKSFGGEFRYKFEPEEKFVAETNNLSDRETENANRKLIRENAKAEKLYYRKLGFRTRRGKILQKSIITGKWEVIKNRGHSNYIFAVAFSPDDKQVATASWDKTAKIWDYKTEQLITTLKGHTDRLYDIAYSPDGKMIATSSWDKTVILWNSKTGEILNILEGHKGQVMGIAFSPEGNILATVGEDSFLILWNTTTGNPIIKIKAHLGKVNDVVYSRYGKYIFTIGNDQKMKIWKVIPSDKVITLKGHKGIVTGVAFSPDGKSVASGSWDKTVKLWDIKSNKLIHTFKGHKNFAWKITFSPDSKMVASTSMDKTIRIWDVVTGNAIAVLKGHKGGVSAILWSADGKNIVSSSRDKTIIIWNAKTWTIQKIIQRHTERVSGIAFSPDHRYIASVGNDKTLKITDFEVGTHLGDITASNDSISGVAFSPDGNYILTSGKDQKIILWKYPELKKIREYVGHEGWVNNIVFTKDGKHFVSCSDDKTVRFWSRESGKQVLMFNGKTEVITVDISHDGKKVLFGNGNNISIYPINLSCKTSDPAKLLAQTIKDAGVKIDGFKLRLLNSLNNQPREKKNGKKKISKKH